MTRESYKKHRELIEAWSNGAKIEYNNSYTSGWSLCTDKPNWLESTEYRIKPKDETLYEWMTLTDGRWWIRDTIHTIEDAKNIFSTDKDYKQTGRSWKL